MTARIDLASKERVALAYALAVGSYDAACQLEDRGLHGCDEAVHANRAYRTACAWLMDHDLLHPFYPFQGALVADAVRAKVPAVGRFYDRHLAPRLDDFAACVEVPR